MTGHRWEAQSPPGGARAVRLLAALALVALVGVLARSPGAADPAGELPLLHAPEAPGTGGAAPDAGPEAAALPPRGGRWQLLETAPVEVPRTAQGVWTGTHLVVVGAGGETASYDARNRLWWLGERHPSGDAALVHGLTWDGVQVLALAQPLDNAGSGQAVHGYDVASGTWRPLPPAPVRVLPPAVTAWTGDAFLFFGRPSGPRTREGDPAVGAVWRPVDGRWSAMPHAPAERMTYADGVWTDAGLVVWGQVPGAGSRSGGAVFAARYEPGEDRWTALDDPPLSFPADAAAVWTGERVLLWGVPLRHDALGLQVPVGGAALDPGSGTWDLLPLVPGLGPRSWEEARGYSGAWTGSELLLVGGFPQPHGLALDPASARWSALPQRRGVVNPVVAWTGEELLVWGGIGPDGPTAALRAWRPAATP